MLRKSADEENRYQKAAHWFMHSARQGNREAQYKVGLMYSRGFGVSMDYVKAYAWLKVSASQGSAKALFYLRKIARRIPPARLKQARALTHKYYSNFVVPYA